MSDKLKEVKAHTLDLAKVLSYLYELEKTKDQTYVTKEGMAFLEGVVLSGGDKVKVYSQKDFEIIKENMIKGRDLIFNLKGDVEKFKEDNNEQGLEIFRLKNKIKKNKKWWQ